MIGWVLLAVVVGVALMLAFYTWLDRFMVPMEQWNGWAYSAGLLLGSLGGLSIVFLAAGW